jgi:hypothetical protein
MNRRNRPAARVVAVFVAGLAGLVGLVGCGGASGSGATPADDEQTRQTWAEYVRCARANGFPNWPDAVLDGNGRATFPDVAGLNFKTAAAQIRPACGAVLARLPANAQSKEDRPVDEDELARRRQYAECMRRNGVPDWPDPDPDGSFALPDRLARGDKTLTAPADKACKRLAMTKTPSGG